MRILLAEDDPVSRQILRHTIDALGHEVIEAGDGKLALESFLKSPPEVVITDWVMPEMDGPTLCRRIRKAQVCHYVYVIFLTVMNSKMRYLEAMDAGADDFISKPLDREQLAAKLRAAQRMLTLHKEIGELRGALRYCPGCKSYCDDQDHWRPIENLLQPTVNKSIQPRICPECQALLARSAAD